VACAILLRLWRDPRGITSLELALTFPFILLLIFGTLEIDRVMYMQLLLQAAVADASRYGFTGNASADSAAAKACPAPFGNSAPLANTVIDTKYETSCRIVEDLCPQSLPPTNAPLTSCPFDITQVTIGLTNFADLQDLGSNTGGATGAGLGNQLVIYKVTYNLPFATGILNRTLGPSIPIIGNAIVYNEPFLAAGGA
jgi:Flp pilus assembly protein TadG